MIAIILSLFGRNRVRQLETLHEYHERLRSVISDLLALVDEVDQQSKFSGVPSDEWSTQLKAACNDLVKLGNSLPEIERLLHDNKVNESREVILQSCRKATDIAKQLHRIRRS
jgi:hypothetical protein